MSRRTLAALTLLSGLTLAGFQAHLKQQPTTRELASAARRMQRPSLWDGKLAPDFTLPTRGGGSFRLADQVGRKIVILHFFATWSASTRVEIPELTVFLHAHSEDPVELLGINAGEPRDAVDALLQELGVAGYPVAFDDGEVQSKYGVDSLPTTILIGADGRVQLYEPSAVTNADVAFGADLLEPSFAQLKAAQGITQANYLDLLESEDYGSVRDTDAETERLDARARSIAERMTCPCGCAHTVLACTCRTGRRIKERLRLLRFSDKSDAELIEGLNREFCMGPMT